MKESHEILIAVDREVGAKPKNRLTGFSTEWHRELTGLSRGWTVVEKDLRDVIVEKINAQVLLIEVKHNLSRLHEVASSIAECQKTTSQIPYIIFAGHLGMVDDMVQRQELYEHFPQPERIEFVSNQNDVTDRIRDIIAKLKAMENRRTPPRPSPLDAIQAVIEATADLRESGGNLSARKIADLYDIKMAELARLLGRTPQALSKTPNADAIQNDLAYFERIARLRLRLKDDDSFRKWLRMKNDELDGHTPLEVLKMKKWQELADFVDDMLTGAPA